MGRYKEIMKLLIMIVTLCHWVCQNGVKGNILRNDQSEVDNYEEEATNTEVDEIDEDNEKILSDKLNNNEPPSQSKFEDIMKLLKENGEKVKNRDNTKAHNLYTSDLGTPDLESDATNTIHSRIQGMPLKLGLQFLTAKYGLGRSLDKARQGGNYIYDGTKGAVKTMTDFVGEGIGNAKFLLFGTK